jgi:Ca2+-binding RTX toxin-like protein
VIANLTNTANNYNDAAGDIYISIENLRGSAFGDLLVGTDADDNVIEGGGGADIMIGGLGIDTASYEHASTGVIANLTDTSNDYGDAAGDAYGGIENLRGSAFGDLLVGFDNTNGTDGANVIEGGGGGDIMIGGLGIDTLSYEHASSAVTVNLADDRNNTGEAAGDHYNGFENIRGSAFGDVLIGFDNTNGTDGANVIEGGGGGDTMSGGLGIDTLSYEHASSPVTVNLADDRSNTGEAAGDHYTGFENIRGSRFADKLIGDAGDNVLEGGAGDDFLSGGEGNDTLTGGAGADRLEGGAGNNTATYSGMQQGVFANLTNSSFNTGDAQGDTYFNIQNLSGTDFSDVLIGDVNDNILDGGGGADALLGGGGNDTASYSSLVSLANNEVVGITASLADSSVNTRSALGDVYNNIQNLLGSAFDDVLIGDSRANILDGGSNGGVAHNGTFGNDTLTGGGGNDTFVFRAKLGRDTVTDFTAGQDVIELHDGLFASATAALAAATQSGNDVIITVDASTSILLQNVALANLHAADFHVV